MSFDEMIAVAETPAAAKKRTIGRKPQDVLGGPPQVSLLPVEIRNAGRGRTTRALLAGGVVVALAVAAGATVLASSGASSAQARLDAANAQTQKLAVQVGKFNDLQKLNQDVTVGKAAAKVGASTEIDWRAQLDDIRQDMPYGYSITQISGDSASVTADYAQGTTPLEKTRAATVDLTVSAPSLLELPIWLRKLRSIPAYADATASVQSADEAGGYTVAVTIHLSPKAELRLAHGGTQQ